MNTEESNSAQQINSKADLGSLLVLLLKGVLYREDDAHRWEDLLALQNQVRDYASTLGLELNLDEAEAYAFLRNRSDSDDKSDVIDKDRRIPRLIARRQLSFPVSMLLALLRKKLAEFDATGGDTRLVLTRDNIIELLRLFLPDSSNEAKLVDQIDRYINKIIELGFLKRLKSGVPKSQPGYEVRRIIKAFIDAQWLAEFDSKLEDYRKQPERSSE